MALIRPVAKPGLFITGTDTGVGKTVVTGAIANWFHKQGRRVGVFKPIATGCEHRREGLVSEDAEFLAHCADARFPLDVICPQRYAEPLAPAVAAERAGQPLDWEAVQRSLSMIEQGSDVMLIEGVGGALVPLDGSHTTIDLMKWLRLPAIVVARPGLGTINHTLLTLQALGAAEVEIAGIVINRYPADAASIAEETNPRMIEKWGKIPILCVVPDEPLTGTSLSPGIVEAVQTFQWESLLHSSIG